jgi:hypothetical protein
LETNRKHADKMLVWIMRELVYQQRRWWSWESWLDTIRMEVISAAFYLAVRKFGSNHFTFKDVAPLFPADPVYVKWQRELSKTILSYQGQYFASSILSFDRKTNIPKE